MNRCGQLRMSAAAGAALAGLILVTGCGSHPLAETPRAESAVTCPAAAPHPGLPAGAIGAADLVPAGPVSASVCQYDTNSPADWLPGMPRQIMLTGIAAAGLAAVIDSGEPASAYASRCDRPAHLEPFAQEIIFSYAARPARTVTVAFTDCNLGLVAAARRVGVLPFQTDADLFGYTSITTGRGGSARTPDLIGLSASAAAARARGSHFTVNFDGAVIDLGAPPGTVVFQSLPPGARDSGPGGQVDILLAAGRVPACRTSQLALSYLGGGAGAGNDFGTLLVRDTSGRPCTLMGPLLITGLGIAGRPATTTSRDRLTGVTVLTAHAGPVGWRSPGTLTGTRPGELAGLLVLMSEYRDGPANVDGGLCAPLWVVPATWRVTFPGGHVLTVANADPADPAKLVSSGGFVTCRGQLGLAQPAMVGSP